MYEIEGPEGSDPSAIVEQILSTQAAAPPESGPSIVDQAARQAGIGGRAVIEGLGQLAALPSDALFGLVNFIQAQRGEPMPFKLASESISEGLTAAGLPQPETGAERFASRVVGALSGTGGTIGVGRALAGAAIPAPAGAVRSAPAPGPTAPSGAQVYAPSPAAAARAPLTVEAGAPRAPLPQAAGEMLAAAPLSQGAGALGGTTASQLAAAVGAPAPVQIAAGMVGGSVAGAAVPTTAAAGRGTRALVDPLTESGRRTIAGRVLNTAATNADDAGARLAQRAEDLVPGSAATTGQVARDPGLAFFETRLRALGDPRFGQRQSQQNAARQALLDSVADGGLPESIARRVARREQVTTTLRDRAFRQAEGQRVPAESILSRIDELRADPENAGRSVQQALTSVRRQLFDDNDQLITDARALYAVRKEINRILEGRYVGADESVLRYAGGQLSRVRGAIDDAITEVAPSWKQYLIKYAQLSRPIERAETVQDIRQRTGLAAPDLVTGRDYLSQAKWKQTVTRALPELSQTMTKGQIKKLQRIGEDLDRGAAVAAANKLPGSDTAANLAVSGQISVAHVIGRALGKNPQDLPPALSTVARPLSFLYKLPDESVRQLLVDAMLDPKLAEQLMRQGTTENVRRFVDEFARSTRASTVGAESGLAAQEMQ
jgi:hypothetical protein